MKHKGYTLIDVLACIALVVALLPAASKMYVSIGRLHAAQTAALDRLSAFEEVERDLRQAARAAVAVEPAFGAYTTGDRTVVLRGRAGYTVFTVDADLQPQRITFAPREGGWEQRITTYRRTHWRARFEARNGMAEFFARPPHGTVPRRAALPEVHVMAAIGGGWGRGQ